MKKFVKLSVCNNYTDKFTDILVDKDQIQSVTRYREGHDVSKSVINLVINGELEVFFSDDTLEEIQEILNK